VDVCLISDRGELLGHFPAPADRDGAGVQCKPSFPPWPTTSDALLGDDVGEAASVLRRAWRIPDGPVVGLANYIESAGPFMVRVNVGHPKVDAASAHPRREACRWILLNTMATDGARERLTIGHGLGHAVLHHWDAFNVGSKDEREAQAFKFALALLVTARDFIIDVSPPAAAGTTSGGFAARSGVSAAALARRARDLGLISPEHYKNLNVERHRRGHWNEEPGRTELKQPTVVRDAIAVLAEQADWTANDFSQRGGLPYERLRDLLPDYFRGSATPAMRLRSVK